MTMRQDAPCSRCRGPRDKAYAYCRDCRNAYKRLENARRGKAATTARYRERTYGVTPAHYEALLASQDGLCAICRKPETATRGGDVKPLAVDHDHDTGEVRGLLCSRCNTAIGLLDDDPDTVWAALGYLMSDPTITAPIHVEDRVAEGWAAA